VAATWPQCGNLNGPDSVFGRGHTAQQSGTSPLTMNTWRPGAATAGPCILSRSKDKQRLACIGMTQAYARRLVGLQSAVVAGLRLACVHAATRHHPDVMAELSTNTWMYTRCGRKLSRWIIRASIGERRSERSHGHISNQHQAPESESSILVAKCPGW
jgi:hypothetical protein